MDNLLSYACGENWHDPVKCHLLKKWQKKCDDDSETSNWIAANTKVRITVVCFDLINFSCGRLITIKDTFSLKGMSKV